jgi:large subunit ribosomal protein L30
MNNTNTIRIKLVKSLIGRLPKHITIAKQLGLRKINSVVEHQDTPSIRGLVNVIYYLVHVEESV